MQPVDKRILDSPAAQINKESTRGVRIVEDPEGNVTLTYAEKYESPFRGPVIANTIFENWSQAINYLKLWDVICHVQWW